MSWKEFIKATMTYRKPKNGWPETTPNYVGVANEEVAFPCISVDEKKTFFNPAMDETCHFVYGVVLLVAKYKGKYFFSCEKFHGDFFCSSAVVVDFDRDLVNRFSREPPKHAFFVSNNIEVDKPKVEIVKFAKDFLLNETRNYPYMRDYVDGAVKLFSEAI